MAAMRRLLSFASSVIAVNLYCIGLCYRELDMSNSQQGCNWTQSFVFLDTRNGEKVELVHRKNCGYHSRLEEYSSSGGGLPVSTANTIY